MALAVGIGLACISSLTLSVAATNFDIHDSQSVRSWGLASDPAWVDHANLGPATLVRAEASWGDVHLQLFWNRSIRNVDLVPGALPIDAYPHGQLTFSDNGTLLLKGHPLSGPIVADEWVTPMTFRNARRIAASPFDELLLPQKYAQLELYAPGFYRDGLLKPAGSIHLWPAQAGGAVQGRLSFRVHAPQSLPATVTLQITRDGGAPLAIRVPPGGTRDIKLTVCSTGRWDLGFSADHSTRLERRLVSLNATPPIWRPDATACPAG